MARMPEDALWGSKYRIKSYSKVMRFDHLGIRGLIPQPFYGI
jgi:hypothetical protein